MVFLLVGSSLFAGIDDKNKKKSSKKKAATTAKARPKPVVKPEEKKDDTTKVVVEDEIFMDSVDSLLMFPSHDLYGSWDTEIIHPYHFDQQFTGDSTTIYLLDDWSCGFTMPFRGPITSGFGWRRRRPHYGTDINLETGDTVVAAFDGMVRIAKFNKGGYGNVVIIRHNNGLETVYGHLSKLLVEPETEVTAGTVIGLGGNTGHSYGSHLHFEMRYLGKAIDTEDLVDYEKGEVKNSAFVLYKEDFTDKYDLRAIHASKVSKSHATSKYSGSAVKTAKNGTKYVVVRNGDTLSAIAVRNHTSVSSICKKNGIKPTKVLQIGMKLKL